MICSKTHNWYFDAEYLILEIQRRVLFGVKCFNCENKKYVYETSPHGTKTI